MSDPTVNVFIDDYGDVEIDVEGAEGAECEELTKELERDLGVVRSREHKPEYNQRARRHTRSENHLHR